MKKVISSLLFCLLALNAIAQDAKSILDKTSSTLLNSGAMSAEFSIRNVNKKQPSASFTQTGKAIIKGNRFKIENSDGVTWFDGKTQWTYLKGNNEVNISNPDGEELASVSPVSILNVYKSGFSLANKGSATVDGHTVFKIEMKPQKKNSGVLRYLLMINKQTYLVSSILIENRNGNNTSVTLSKYQSGLSVTDKIFVFNKKEYPQAEIVDLR